MIKFALQVWAGPLSGQRLAVILWNRYSKPANITANWHVLGLDSSTSVSIKDLWKVSTNTYICSILLASLKLTFFKYGPNMALTIRFGPKSPLTAKLTILR